MIYLPINQIILNSHTADCWAYYCYLSKTITKSFFNFSNNSITISLTLNSKNSINGRTYAELGRTIWSKYSRDWEKDKILIINTNTTLMPLEVFDVLHDKLLDVAPRSRNSYCKFYLTMYFLCHSHVNDYGITIERLSTMLTSNTNDICRKIRFFLDNGLLRRMGKYNPETGVPYRYFIPPEYCSKLN